jgi:tripartite motif-containing protein 37
MQYCREFSSEFDTGECWGYNKFFKIENLIPEGYLIPEKDQIELKYFVRANTYQ